MHKEEFVKLRCVLTKSIATPSDNRLTISLIESDIRVFVGIANKNYGFVAITNQIFNLESNLVGNHFILLVAFIIVVEPLVKVAGLGENDEKNKAADKETLVFYLGDKEKDKHPGEGNKDSEALAGAVWGNDSLKDRKSKIGQRQTNQ